MKHNQMRQVVFPILAAFIWGTSFVSQDICADSMGAFTFNGTRYFIAVLSLLVVIAVMNTTRKDRPQPTAEEKKASRKQLWLGGLCCGTALAIASNFQQAGLVAGTDAGKAGFITALYVVLVPLFGLFFRRKVSGPVWIAVVLKSPTGQQRFEDAKALLNYGFSTYALLHTVPEEPFPAIPVVLGETETVQPCIDPQEAVALVQKSQAGGLSQSVTLAEQVEAPVSTGQELGTLTLTDAAGETVQTIPIRAAQSVERLTFGTMLRRMLSAAFFAG